MWRVRQTTTGIVPYPNGILRFFFRLPLWAYQWGLGWLVGWLPFLVLGTQGRKSGLPRYTMIEFRKHGKRYYLLSGWGTRPDWYQNLLQNPLVTVQQGSTLLRARATPVTDRDEMVRVMYMFRKSSPFYDVLLASMSSAEYINPTTLPDVATEFTLVRLDPEAGALPQPSIQQYPAWFVPLSGTVLMLVFWWLTALWTGIRRK